MATYNSQQINSFEDEGERQFDNTPIPDGVYHMQIFYVEDKPNSAGTGDLTSIGFRVLNGEFEGKAVFKSFNLGHQSDAARAAAQREVEKLFVAAGIQGTDRDTDYLLNEEVICKVCKAGWSKTPRNDIESFKPITNEQKNAAPAPAAAQPQNTNNDAW